MNTTSPVAYPLVRAQSENLEEVHRVPSFDPPVRAQSEIFEVHRTSSLDPRACAMLSKGLQAYREDTRENNERLERVAQTATALASQELQASRKEMRASAARLERFTTGALKVASDSTQNAYECARQAEQTALAAVSANQQVSLAAVQASLQGVASVEKLASETQSTVRQILQSVSSEARARSEEDQKARREAKLEELLGERALWEIIQNPATPQAAIVQIARTKITLLNQLQQNLVDQKQRERAQEEQTAVELKQAAQQRLTADMLHARAAKIGFAKKTIVQSRSSFDLKNQDLAVILVSALVACFASYSFGNRKTTAIVITLGCSIFAVKLYKTVLYSYNLSYRAKWLNIYIRALDRLIPSPQLTVRSAVQEILDGDFSIASEHKASHGTRAILDQIKDEPVIVEPGDTTTAIPRALTFIVDHAIHQPLKSFTEL